VINLRLVVHDCHMDPEPWPNTVAAELGHQLGGVAGDGQVLFGGSVGGTHGFHRRSTHSNGLRFNSCPLVFAAALGIFAGSTCGQSGVSHAALRSSDQPLSITAWTKLPVGLPTPLSERSRYRSRGVDEANPEQTERMIVTELLQGRPLALTELVQHLDTRGQLDWLRDDDVREDEMAGALVDCVVVTDEIWSGPARLALSSHLTEGLVLAHRLKDEEVERQEVEVTPDLVLLDWNVGEALRLGPDALLKQWPGDHVPGEDHSFVAGPDGWLSGFLPGDVVAFVRNGDSVRVSSVTDLANNEHEMALLREAVDYRIPGHR
jgi:hypothetical protein